MDFEQRAKAYINEASGDLSMKAYFEKTFATNIGAIDSVLKRTSGNMNLMYTRLLSLQPDNEHGFTGVFAIMGEDEDEYFISKAVFHLAFKANGQTSLEGGLTGRDHKVFGTEDAAWKFFKSMNINTKL